MLFNKDNTGSQELRELTSNYYTNNDFRKIEGEIELATDELAQLLGTPLIELAEKYYHQPEEKGADAVLVRKVQNTDVRKFHTLTRF